MDFVFYEHSQISQPAHITPCIESPQTILHSYTPIWILKTFPRLELWTVLWINGYTKRKQAMGTSLFISLALFTSHLFVWLDLRFPGWERGLLGQNEVLGKVRLQGMIISSSEDMISLHAALTITSYILYYIIFTKATAFFTWNLICTTCTV